MRLGETWQKYRLPTGAALLVLLLTALAYFAASELVERQARDRFEFRTHQISDAIAQRLEGYVNVLRAGTALFDATGHVTREMWQVYVENLALDRTFPGFQGIGYSARIAADRLERHHEFIRAQGFPDYHVHPTHERAEYHSIVYLEPFDWRNQRAFGYDMFTEPTRRAAMSRARDTGEPAMSGRVILVQETDEDVQAGFLIYHPVYRPGAPTGTVEERRAALLGFVYSPVRMDNLLHGLLGVRPPGVDYEVYDGVETDLDSRMYASTDTPNVSPRFTAAQQIEVAGHVWTLRMRSQPSFEQMLDHRRPLQVLLAGLIAAVLVFLTVRSSIARREGALALLEARREQEAELRRLNAALERRVHERTAALEFANRELEAFAYSVSHDLRAPLRAIGGFSERLSAELGDELPTLARHYLDRMRAGVARMRQLIDDLLALSRVARGDLMRNAVDLSETARAVLSDLRAGDPDRDVETVVDDTPAARGDPRLLRIALENLLENAWKFTGKTPDARIRFGAYEDGGAVVWFVEDNGAGFDAAHSEQLFRPFQRLHGEDEYPGTGIGLATVSRIIRRHGGRLWTQAAPGRGATFYFTIGGYGDGQS